jgi:hypothetical protein
VQNSGENKKNGGEKKMHHLPWEPEYHDYDIQVSNTTFPLQLES